MNGGRIQTIIILDGCLKKILWPTPTATIIQWALLLKLTSCNYWEQYFGCIKMLVLMHPKYYVSCRYFQEVLLMLKLFFIYFFNTIYGKLGSYIPAFWQVLFCPIYVKHAHLGPAACLGHPKA